MQRTCNAHATHREFIAVLASGAGAGVNARHALRFEEVDAAVLEGRGGGRTEQWRCGECKGHDTTHTDTGTHTHTDTQAHRHTHTHTDTQTHRHTLGHTPFDGTFP